MFVESHCESFVYCTAYSLQPALGHSNALETESLRQRAHSIWPLFDIENENLEASLSLAQKNHQYRFRMILIVSQLLNFNNPISTSLFAIVYSRQWRIARFNWKMLLQLLFFSLIFIGLIWNIIESISTDGVGAYGTCLTVIAQFDCFHDRRQDTLVVLMHGNIHNRTIYSSRVDCNTVKSMIILQEPRVGYFI